MEISKNIQLIIFGLLIILSGILVGRPLVFQKSGVMVVSVPENSPCSDILIENSIITAVNNVEINDADEFYKEINSGEESYSFIINGNPRFCDTSGEDLGIQVSDLRNTALKLGLDVGGGKKITLKTSGDNSKENLEEISEIISERADKIGVSELEINTVNSIELSFIEDEEFEIEKIIKPGIIQFKLPQKVKIKDGLGEFQLGDKKYDFSVNNDTLVFDGSSFEEDGIFVVDDVEFEIEKISSNETRFLMNVLDNQDISEVLSGGEYSRVFEQSNNVFVFVFRIELTPEGSEKFEKVTKNQESIITNLGETILKEQMLIFIDSEKVHEMPISDLDAGKNISMLNIWGFESRKSLAQEKMDYLITFLGSETIENLEVVDTQEIEGNTNIIKNASIGFLGICLITSVAIYLKTKSSIKILLIFGLMLTQILILFGFVSSKPFLILGLISSVVFIALGKNTKSKLDYLIVSLLFLMSFGLFINETAINVNFILGIILSVLVVCLGFIREVGLVNNNFLRKIYSVFEPLLVLVSLVLFFVINDFQVISIVISSNYLLFLGFSKPIINRIGERD